MNQTYSSREIKFFVKKCGVLGSKIYSKNLGVIPKAFKEGMEDWEGSSLITYK
jgi:hypothetical protein